MINKKQLIFIFTLVPILVLWFSIAQLLTAFDNPSKNDWTDIIGVFINFPLIIFYPFSYAALLLLNIFYVFVWMWLEPLIYFKYLYNKNITPPILHKFKIVTFILFPILIIGTPKLISKLDEDVPAQYLNNEMEYARCDINYNVNSMFNNDEEYFLKCETNQFCEVLVKENKQTKDVSYNYYCCPKDKIERNFISKKSNIRLYPHCDY